ncbi:MAG: hypothetical protein H0T89_19320 [Deltaproteobacteria bacterium]|nr:hypothetical protein [Deltaproteobacteria bacterium]MDQ3301472.1 hypothetical protein [Myxococcota bacterium]
MACALLLGLAEAVSARPLHGSAGVGGTFVLTGSQGDRTRADVAIDIKPWNRFGGLVAWRAFDEERRGLVVVGLVYEAAAARPRLVLDLIVQAGADLDAEAPVIGGSIRSTLTIIGPLGLALETTAYLVYDGIAADATRLQIQSNALVVVSW